jgi:hypothetical protein
VLRNRRRGKRVDTGEHDAILAADEQIVFRIFQSFQGVLYACCGLYMLREKLARFNERREGYDVKVSMIDTATATGMALRAVLEKTGQPNCLIVVVTRFKMAAKPSCCVRCSSAHVSL